MIYWITSPSYCSNAKKQLFTIECFHIFFIFLTLEINSRCVYSHYQFITSLNRFWRTYKIYEAYLELQLQKSNEEPLFCSCKILFQIKQKSKMLFISSRDRWEYNHPSQLLAGKLQMTDVIQVKDPHYSRLYLPPKEIMKISQKYQKQIYMKSYQKS